MPLLFKIIETNWFLFSSWKEGNLVCCRKPWGLYSCEPCSHWAWKKCYWTLNLSEEISPFMYKATSESQLARRVFWLIKGCDVSNTGKWSHQRKLLLPSVLCLQTQRTPLCCVTPGPILMVLFPCRRLWETSGLALMDSVPTPWVSFSLCIFLQRCFILLKSQVSLAVDPAVLYVVWWFRKSSGGGAGGDGDGPCLQLVWFYLMWASGVPLCPQVSPSSPLLSWGSPLVISFSSHLYFFLHLWFSR